MLAGVLPNYRSRIQRMATLLMVAATLLSATRPCCPLVDGVRPLCATPSFSAAQPAEQFIRFTTSFSCQQPGQGSQS